VFYPAGFTWVDGCEREPARARAANLEQPCNLATAAAAVQARFVYFSTDYVFDGHDGPYREESTPHPLSVYGHTKRDAEIALGDILKNDALVVRTSWVFGPERQGKNFAYQLCRTLAAGTELVCPSDQRSNPSYGPSVAKAVVALLEQGRSGIVHVVGPELMDRCAFARAIASSFGLDPTLIVAKTTASLGQQARRPLRSGLLTPLLDAWLPGAMPGLADDFEDFHQRLAADPTLARPLPKY
jgi:dTDP-4-dehydrorhamnose reductase